MRDLLRGHSLGAFLCCTFVISSGVVQRSVTCRVTRIGLTITRCLGKPSYFVTHSATFLCSPPSASFGIPPLPIETPDCVAPSHIQMRNSTPLA